MVESRAGVMDVISMASNHDTILVLPTLQHAIALWNDYRDAIEDRHGFVRRTKTTCVMPMTRTVLRLWVPYEREPSMVMDHSQTRSGFDYVTPYDKEVIPSWA